VHVASTVDIRNARSCNVTNGWEINFADPAIISRSYLCVYQKKSQFGNICLLVERESEERSPYTYSVPGYSCSVVSVRNAVFDVRL